MKDLDEEIKYAFSECLPACDGKIMAEGLLQMKLTLAFQTGPKSSLLKYFSACKP